jgi:hypothetical protein
VFTLACGLLLSDGAAAQPLPNRVTKPPISPYLNIVRRGNSAAFNYFTLVRPELEFRGALQQLDQGANRTQRDLQGLEAEYGMPATGHSSYFLNYSGHFMNLQGSRAPVVQGAPTLPPTDRLGGSPTTSTSRRPTSGSRR